MASQVPLRTALSRLELVQPELSVSVRLCARPQSSRPALMKLTFEAKTASHITLDDFDEDDTAWEVDFVYTPPVVSRRSELRATATTDTNRREIGIKNFDIRFFIEALGNQAQKLWLTADGFSITRCGDLVSSVSGFKRSQITSRGWTVANAVFTNPDTMRCRLCY
jgi:hypothetical protein